MSGWIRLHRGWRECDVFTGEAASEREAWVHLIEIAAWKPMLRRAGKGDVIQVNRGQLHTAERTLADMWSWDRKRVKRFLNRLEKYGMISQDSGPSGNLVTIRNYEAYQTLGTDDGAIHGTNQGPSEDHPRTTQEERIRKEKKGEEGKKKTFELPDWVSPEAWAEWEEHRKQVKAPLTDTSRAKCVKVLEEATAAGFSTEETIQQSIVSGWRGLFVPKGKPASTPNPMKGMSFAQARERIKELEYDLEMNRHMAEHDRDKYLPKWRATKEELEALRKAVDGKGF